jgi:hypothetical protein
MTEYIAVQPVPSRSPPTGQALIPIAALANVLVALHTCSMHRAASHVFVTNKCASSMVNSSCLVAGACMTARVLHLSLCYGVACAGLCLAGAGSVGLYAARSDAPSAKSAYISAGILLGIVAWTFSTMVRPLVPLDLARCHAACPCARAQGATAVWKQHLSAKID